MPIAEPGGALPGTRNHRRAGRDRPGQGKSGGELADSEQCGRSLILLGTGQLLPPFHTGIQQDCCSVACAYWQERPISLDA